MNRKLIGFLFSMLIPALAICGGKDIYGNDLTRASKLGYVDGELTSVGAMADFAEVKTNDIKEIAGTIATNTVTDKVAAWALKPNPAPVTDLTPAINYTTAVSNKLEKNKQDKLPYATNAIPAKVIANPPWLTHHQSLSPATNFTRTATNDLATTLRGEMGNYVKKDGSTVMTGTLKTTGVNVGVNNTIRDGFYGASAIGSRNTATNSYSFAHGYLNVAGGNAAHAEGSNSQAMGNSSHAEGNSNQALGDYSHAEGRNNEAIGSSSHAEGYSNKAIGNFSHAEGLGNESIGNYSHSEGSENKAIGSYSHTSGFRNVATNSCSTAIGFTNLVYGGFSTAIGWLNQITANATTSLAVGYDNYVDGNHSIAMGQDSVTTNTRTFVWNAPLSWDRKYYSHGDYTFNVNPYGGAKGFWIGERNLSDMLDDKQDKLPYSTNAIPAGAIANPPWITDHYVRSALWSNEVNQIWRDLALEVKTYAHDPVNDRYYKLYADATGGSVTAAIDTNGVDYADIADPYWRRYANDYLGDVTAWVISVTNNENYCFYLYDGNASVGEYVDWGDGSDSDYYHGNSWMQARHVYTKGGRYVVSIRATAPLMRVDVGSYQYPGTNSAASVIRALRYGNAVENAGIIYYGCTNLCGRAPDWNRVKTAPSCYRATQIGSILIPPSAPYCNMFSCYKHYTAGGDAEVEGVGNADVYMPANVGGGDYVSGRPYSVRKHFFTFWGGSNGWTGEYYTQANAPVPSLVGERIYEPIGNCNSFEIKIGPQDFTNNLFTFEMRVRAIAGRNIRVDWGDGTLTTYPSNEFAQAMAIISHDYVKASAKTNVFTVCVDSGARLLQMGTKSIENATRDDSNWYVTRALAWSDTITECFSGFRCCHNMIGTLPPWKNQTGVGVCYYKCYGVEGAIPEYNANVTYNNMYSCYTRCSKLTGLIPRWPDLSNLTSDGVRSVYFMCTGLTGFWNGTGVDAQSLSERCPTEVNHAYTYQSASDAVRNLVYVSWGGTIPDPE